MLRHHPLFTLFPYTTLFRSVPTGRRFLRWPLLPAGVHRLPKLRVHSPIHCFPHRHRSTTRYSVAKHLQFKPIPQTGEIAMSGSGILGGGGNINIVAPQGPLVSVLHTERQMRIFGVTENELRTLTIVNAAVAFLFSLGTGCFGYLLNLDA